MVLDSIKCYNKYRLEEVLTHPPSPNQCHFLIGENRMTESILPNKIFTCQTCGTDFLNTKGKDRKPKFCSKECYKKQFISYVEDANMRRCRSCLEIKPRTEFFSNHINKNRLRPECKICSAEVSRQYRKDNYETILQKKRQYYFNNRSYSLEKCKEWVKNNPEKRKEIVRRHYHKNIDRFREKVRARRHKRRGNGGSFTPQEWKNLCNMFGNICLDCGENKPLTVDHIIPITLGGTSYIHNIQPLCLSCNSRKSDQAIDYRLKWKEIERHIVNIDMLRSVQ